VALVHADDERLQAMAVLDVILNNGDRKGGHVITDVKEDVWAVDHGVTLSVEPKLRTVLWGWAGSAIPAQLLAAVEGLYTRLNNGAPEIERWLDRYEVEALIDRCAALLATQTFPVPNEEWPAIPWPVF
jgi:uncharacterized repeat protein (TIGR03843 family)